MSSWPPAETRWRTLRCRAGTEPTDGTLELLDLTEESGDNAPTMPPGEIVTVAGRRGRVGFRYRFDHDTNVVGPMLVTLCVSLDGADDFPIFTGIRKFRHGREVTFEGSYGFQGDLVTHGMLLVSHRAIDPALSEPHHPYHPHDRSDPVTPGQPVNLTIELLPSATRFRAGEELRLDLQGSWFHHRDPIRGQFPVGYRTHARGRLTLHLDGAGCTLTIPTLE